MAIIDEFRKLAKGKNSTIVFPEGEEERVIKAAIFLAKNKLIKPILLGNHEKIRSLAKSIDFEGSNDFTKNRRGKISGRGKSQLQYLGQIKSSDIKNNCRFHLID